jgi:Holliday junction DNA helicase RuvA
MIGKLKGILDSIGDDWIIIDVQGVGYLVHCSSKTFGQLPAIGEAVTIFIETHVRETEIKLFGFTSELDKEWFRLLQSVQGVGAKVALAALGALSPNDLSSAIALQDKAMVAQAPGIGPKVAQRIVTELKDKVPAVGGTVTELHDTLAAADAGAVAGSVPAADAVSALMNLGYPSQHASEAVAKAVKKLDGEEVDSATLIRLGLKELAN